ncbi:MAG: S9 family peptidase [Bacteroidales bacterium]|nr:S9 family peptidase [Bacteroidales bacterium]
MKHTKYHLVIILILFSTSIISQNFNPPKTPTKAVVDTLHGFYITDNYQWLEDKTNEEVIEWTRNQHDETIEYVNQTCTPIDGLKEEITAYIDRDIIGPISLKGERQFFTVKKKGDAQSKLFTRIDGKDILIFDPEEIDPSGKSSISGMSFTEKADIAAIGVQNQGAEISSYYIIDTKTGKIKGEPIEELRGFTWAKDGKHAYITVGTQEMIENQIPLRTYWHKIGSKRSKDKFLLAPEDSKNYVSIYDSRYSDVSFILEGDFQSNTIKMRKAGTFDEPIELFSSDEYLAYPEAIDDKLYFFTNYEAPNYKIMIADKDNPGFENWKEFYGEKETVLENYIVTPKNLIIQDKKDVLSRLLLYDLEGNFIKEIELPDVGNVSGINYHRESNTIFVSLTTFTSPTKIYKLDGDTFDWELFYEREIPINTDNIEAKIDFYESKDGTKVPIFIIYKKGLELDGNNPALLYGYGGFNIGMSPRFVGLSATFVNRGGVYAIACLRGGDEYGEKWHEDGMQHKKQNTFDDFIAAAEYLIDQKYTNKNKLAIKGGSNGGLLIGAVLTQRPDLFNSAICAVPLLDMIRFHKFLIARYWIPEYGDAETNQEDFEYMLTYSPYHNVRQGLNLPTTLVTAGANDTRVDALHAKKFVAELQNNPGQIDPIMLYIDYDSGHGSGKSTEQLIEEIEFQWRFIMNQLEMN